ncbi:MFS transporter [Pseudopedobacter sp.]|uniref:MFS transporter n=1 Tax=Pseudopedobacter sp. TaxID=1936787 RepID=UPI00333FF7ED
MKKLRAELDFFKTQPMPMRKLLQANLVYALVLPLLELFIGAYILRNSADVSLVIFFQLAQGTGIPITFMLNNYLLKFFSVAAMYSTGMVLSGVSMGVMMLLPELDATGVATTGFLMGLAYGFFWANRVYLAMSSTKDQNRNYFYGLETFFFTVAYILMPLIAGYFIAAAHRYSWFNSNLSVPYYILTALVLLLTFLASSIIRKGQYKNPPSLPFIYFKFHHLWNKMLYMAVFKGVAQGFVITAPVMLVMKLVGNEGALGSIQAAGSFLSAMMLYVLGRLTTPRHRLKIFAAGLSLFVVGATLNMLMYSLAGAVLFIACQVFSRPLLDLAYFPIQLGVTECVAKKENRSQLTYIFSHEIGLFTGRLFGCSLFMLIAGYFGDEAALRYALFAVALVQFFSVFIARSILKNKEWCDAEKIPLSENDLKEPSEL